MTDASIEPETSTTRTSRQSTPRRARVRNTGRSGTSTSRPVASRWLLARLARSVRARSSGPPGRWVGRGVVMPVSAGRSRLASWRVSSSTIRAISGRSCATVASGSPPASDRTVCSSSTEGRTDAGVEQQRGVRAPGLDGGGQHLLAYPGTEQLGQFRRPLPNVGVRRLPTGPGYLALGPGALALGRHRTARRARWHNAGPARRAAAAPARATSRHRSAGDRSPGDLSAGDRSPAGGAATSSIVDNLAPIGAGTREPVRDQGRPAGPVGHQPGQQQLRIVEAYRCPGRHPAAPPRSPAAGPGRPG